MSSIVSTEMAKAAELDFLIQRGDDLAHIVQIVDVNGVLFPVTGYTATFDVYLDALMDGSPLLTLSSAGGGITVSGPAGQFTLVMTEAATTALAWSNGYYKFQMTSPGGFSSRIMQGECSVL